ncbi:hypothetical protein [Streptomyces hypolithicus]
MHSYDPSRHQPYQSQIPAMRPSRDSQTERSHTPIFDALYSEYRRSFRALPGDRSGEEDLRFTGFTGYTTGMHRSQGPGSGSQGSHGTGFWQSAGSGTGSHGRDTGTHSSGRQHSGNHSPPALPPAPRRGL